MLSTMRIGSGSPRVAQSPQSETWKPFARAADMQNQDPCRGKMAGGSL